MLILIRHGETAANVSGLLLGRQDPPLTDLGCQQAHALAAALSGCDRVIASPLRRARDTAAKVAAAACCEVEIDERWVELDYGELDGHHPDDVAEDLWSRWRADTSFVPPGGESLAVLGARVRAACTDLAAEARDRDVVVVSHVSPIKAAVAWALGAGDNLAWRLYVEDASICRIAIGVSGPLLVAFNEHPPPRLPPA